MKEEIRYVLAQYHTRIIVVDKGTPHPMAFLKAGESAELVAVGLSQEDPRRNAEGVFVLEISGRVVIKAPLREMGSGFIPVPSPQPLASDDTVVVIGDIALRLALHIRTPVGT